MYLETRFWKHEPAVGLQASRVATTTALFSSQRGALVDDAENPQAEIRGEELK